nr:leucyl aminopeptidase family protein [Rubellimicrobium sp. CFH 75288]
MPLRLVAPDALEAALAGLPPAQAAWARATGFRAGRGEVALLPGPDGEPAGALLGRGEGPGRQRFALAAAAGRLPAGIWRLEGASGAETREAGLGWLLDGIRFDRRAAPPEAPPRARLAAPGAEAPLLESLAAAEALGRSLIDAPASELSPEGLEAAARALARRHGATLSVTAGRALEDGFPLIAAVGRAAAPDRAPRLLDLCWEGAAEGPRLTLVGKGVTFDTGGLDLKPSASMALMKKDMGGAAHVLAAAEAILAARWPVRLRVLIPVAENAVGPASLRPGDILASRRGLTVEVNNTDAEGRLILADALALAAEEGPDLCACFATLTGAARVALGPDLAPLFATDDAWAGAVLGAAAEWFDPVWRLPFHEPYEALIEPGHADLDNAPGGGMAGALTAALFLRRFAPRPFLHFDVYAWCPKAEPGRPKGGTLQGVRALLAGIAARWGMPWTPG